MLDMQGLKEQASEKQNFVSSPMLECLSSQLIKEIAHLAFMKLER